MEVMYKCKCQEAERTILVPDRVPETNILMWMECVTYCIGYDHRASNPSCRETNMEYAKIPVLDEYAGIGTNPKRQ